MTPIMIPIKMFTHPVCTGCSTTILLLQEMVDENPDLDLQFFSLASDRGREKAKALQVLSVPTVFIGDTRFVGTPNRNDLEMAIEEERALTGTKIINV